MSFIEKRRAIYGLPNISSVGMLVTRDSTARKNAIEQLKSPARVVTRSTVLPGSGKGGSYDPVTRTYSDQSGNLIPATAETNQAGDIIETETSEFPVKKIVLGILAALATAFIGYKIYKAKNKK